MRWLRELLRKICALQHHTRDTLTSSLCVILCRLTCGSGMTTVSPIKTPQLSAVLYTITTMHVSSLSTIPNVLHKTNSTNQVFIVKHQGRQRSRNKKHSQGHATLGGHAEHHFAQGSHPDVNAVREGGQSARLHAANAA